MDLSFGMTRLGHRLLGSHHVDESHLAHQILKRRGAGVMLDVGAAFGESLVPFASDGWQVHAFEPDPANLARLRAAFGSVRDVTIVPKAVADEPGQLTLYSSEQSPGISSLTPFTEHHKPAGTVEVRDARRLHAGGGDHSCRLLEGRCRRLRAPRAEGL